MMKAAVMLADHVAVAEGKLYISGGGWSRTGPIPTPSGIAAKVDLEWQGQTRFHFRFDLTNEDGSPVLLAIGPDGEPQPVFIDGTVDIAGPVEVVPGDMVDVPIGVNIAPLPLEPGRTYTWRLTFEGHSDRDWSVSFRTRAA